MVRRNILFLIVIVIAAAPLASAQDCVDYSTLGGQIGVHDGSANDVVFNGQYLYCCSSSGLTVLDASDPAAPVEVAMLPDAAALQVELDGDRLYAMTSTGFLVLDVSTPASPEIIATQHGPSAIAVYACAATPRNLAPAGDVVYVSLGASGFEVVDVSDPLAMTRIGWFTDFGYVLRIAVDESRAALARGSEGWALLDVADPGAPTVLYENAIGCNVDYDPYSSDCWGWTHVAFEGDQVLTCYYHQRVVEDGLEYETTWDFVVKAYDVSDPGAVSVRYANGLGTSYPKDLVLRDGRAYALMERGLVDIDLSGSEIVLTNVPGLDGATHVDFSEATIAGCGSDVWLLIDPDLPILDLRRTALYNYQSIAYQSDYAYAKQSVTVDAYEGNYETYHYIAILDLSVPSAPVVAKFYFNVNSDRQLEALGDDLLQWQSGHPLRRIDLADPFVALPSEYVLLAGDYVYVDDLAVVGTTAYVARSGNFRVVDLSGDPVEAVWIPALGAVDLQLAGDMIYYRDGSGLGGFDLADPLDPIALPSPATAVAVTTDLLLGGTDEWLFYRNGNDVGWLSVAPDGTLTATGTITLSLQPQEAILRGSTLYVNTKWSSEESRIQAIDFADPAAPVLLGLAETNLCSDLSQTSEAVYLCTSAGLISLPEQCRSASPVTDSEPDLPASTGGARLLAAVPNPFNPTTQIHFHSTRSERVRIDVYGVDGRLVARIADDLYPAGDNTVAWRGCDEQGREMASGVYFARLRTDRDEDTLKLVLLR